jgi:hypothetical protein
MVKLAILNSVTFEKKERFDELEESRFINYLENKVKFDEFNGTMEMFDIIKSVFSYIETPDIDVDNCYYNKEYLMQAFSINNDAEFVHNSIVLVKRKIHKNDTYTFTEFNAVKNIDPYIYEDVTMNDIINIFQRKSVIKCIIVKDDGEIINDNLLYLNSNDDVGKIVLQKCKMEILYLNVSNIVIKNSNNGDSNKIDEIINQKAHAYGANHIFTQIDSGLGILNCFCRSFAEKRNEIMSKMLKQDVYGDTILFLQSNYDNDTETYLDINDELFNKLYNVLINNKKIKRENEHFFNVYREL